MAEPSEADRRGARPSAAGVAIRTRDGRPCSRHRRVTDLRAVRPAGVAQHLLDQGADLRRHLRRRGARAQSPLRPGRPRLARADRAARVRRVGRCPAPLSDEPALPDRPRAGRAAHCCARHAHRSTRAPAGRSSPRPDHSDVRGRRSDRRTDDELPERRRRRPRPHGVLARQRRSQASQHRRGRPGVLPLRDHRGRDHVPARPAARLVEGRSCMGGDSPE